jgi:hypothetical protein
LQLSGMNKGFLRFLLRRERRPRSLSGYIGVHPDLLHRLFPGLRPER